MLTGKNGEKIRNMKYTQIACVQRIRGDVKVDVERNNESTMITSRTTGVNAES